MGKNKNKNKNTEQANSESTNLATVSDELGSETATYNVEQEIKTEEYDENEIFEHGEEEKIENENEMIEHENENIEQNNVKIEHKNEHVEHKNEKIEHKNEHVEHKNEKIHEGENLPQNAYETQIKELINNDSKIKIDPEEEKKEDIKMETESEEKYNSLSGTKKLALKRKPSLYKDVDFSDTLYRPEFQINEKFKDRNEKLWELMSYYIPRDINSIQKSIVNHIEYTLARTRFDLDKSIIYQGTSLSVRDRLLEAWNDTQINIKIKDPKRVSYLSIEFLLGRLLQNALINLDMEAQYKTSLLELGYKLEEVYDKENDPALGNGGLGRLAACYMDSLTTLNIPAWGYGIRYDYGIFKQSIENCEQKELPDYWLTRGNPWEIMRIDVKYKVKFYGQCKDEWKNGKKVRVWEGGDELDAVAFDTVIPGWNTFNCNTLRLWKSFPSEEFDFESFNKGDYSSALEDKDHASYITSVLYPNDSNYAGKELRLKQQYFFCCATIQDIIRRFLRAGLPWSEFPNKNAIQLNDTHPAVSITELLRQLVDIYHLEYEEAFKIISKTFAYTNHTVLPEALEKWSVDLFGKLLPRHLELIYLINHYFLEDVRRKFPNDQDKISRLSFIEEGYPKQIRMANLCIVCSHSVNGVAEIHSNLLKTALFRDFAELYPKRFLNVTNGVTPRRWIHCAFPELSELLTKYNDGQDWLAELSLLEGLVKKLEINKEYDTFAKEFCHVKSIAKKRLAQWVKDHTGQDIDDSFLYDVQVKRIHEYKRQLMNALYCVHRYNMIKSMSKSDREKLVKRVTFFGGKAAPGYVVAKNTIKLINMISRTINNDPDVSKYYKIIFLPDYKVSAAQIIIPAADLSQHISTAGTEASGTSNMKFAMTGSLIIGTRDGANIEIAEQIKEDNIFFFGLNVNEVEKFRHDMRNGKKMDVCDRLRAVINTVLSGKFGDIGFFRDYINNIITGNDFYLICRDFDSYIKAQERVDETYKTQDTWIRKCINSITNMGYFSSDRSIQDYCEKIWEVEPLEVMKPTSKSSERIISCGNLRKLGKHGEYK
jgi:starch phosphorylase